MTDGGGQEAAASIRVQLALPSDPEFVELIRTAVNTLLRRIPGADELASRIEMSLAETFLHSVASGSARDTDLPVHVQLWHDPPYVIATVRRRDVSGPLDQSASGADDGIAMIRQTADRLAVDSQPDGTTITLSWKLDL